MTSNFELSLPPAVDQQALDLLLANLDEELCIQCNFLFEATSGSATSESTTLHIEWKLPPMLGVKIKSIEMIPYIYDGSRAFKILSDVSVESTVVYDAPTTINKLAALRIFQAVASTIDLRPLRIDKGIGVKLPKNQVDVYTTIAFTDTVASASTGACYISLNYQIFKRTEQEYSQLIADAVQ